MERGVAFRLCLVPLGLVGILASAFEGPPSSQKDSCRISILPDRTTGIYRPGDEIAFTVRLTLDGRPVSDSEVAYRIEFNGRQTVSSGTVRTAGGEAVVRTPAREPGSLMARAHCRLGPETGNGYCWENQ